MPDIKIKGYSAEFTYQNVPKLWLADPSQEIGELEEGKTPALIPFTYGEAVPKTVTPDFSGGDMAVPIADGELVNQLTITKPEGLVPENIPEGMYIAGVGPGTFAGGGGSESGDGDTLYDWLNSQVKAIPDQAYRDAVFLRSASFVFVETVGQLAFFNSSNLEKVDFGEYVSSIGYNAFDRCSKLTALIIRAKTMCAGASVMFGAQGWLGDNRGPIALGIGYVYVPSKLVDTYRADTYWSQYQIRAIEDYPDICG